jgi:hypothetical protein
MISPKPPFKPYSLGWAIAIVLIPRPTALHVILATQTQAVLLAQTIPDLGALLHPRSTNPTSSPRLLATSRGDPSSPDGFAPLNLSLKPTQEPGAFTDLKDRHNSATALSHLGEGGLELSFASQALARPGCWDRISGAGLFRGERRPQLARDGDHPIRALWAVLIGKHHCIPVGGLPFMYFLVDLGILACSAYLLSRTRVPGAVG